jgi:glucoamylase
LAVLRSHESKKAPGGLIASLSIPWGSSKGDNDLGGYHLVWSRDLVETAGGLLAAGAHEDVGRVLSYLRDTQQPDGHWAQNMWIDGTSYWNGIQMDETALPILLVDLALRHKALATTDLVYLWAMVRRAAGYLVRNGPVSPQDRWEEDPGYSPFTVAAQIAALLAAADLADLSHEGRVGRYLREVADVWNASIDQWMYVTATDWCERFNVTGYYVRITPRVGAGGGARFASGVRIKNVTASEDTVAAVHLVSPDALALVRFGLRSADDPRMLNTTKIVDALLRIETPTGPTWHRYNGDGYGEHDDGTPFDGTGIGRGWPLLTGERAHFELAGGHTNRAMGLLAAMESFANEGGLISEQVWDCEGIAAHELELGRPSGSATPLVWAHAEYLKLRRSLADGRVFDLPPQTVQRYLIDHTPSPRVIWRFNHRIRIMPADKVLRIETLAPAVVHWTADEWRTVQDATTQDTGLGVHLADLQNQRFPESTQVAFTFYWPEGQCWERRDFAVRLDHTPRRP